MGEIREGEAWLLNVFMTEYKRCGQTSQQHKPKRARKLLLTKREILKIQQKLLQHNCELVPIRMYFSEKQFVKIDMGLGKQKNLADKRDDIIKKDGEREIRRAVKSGGYD